MRIDDEFMDKVGLGVMPPADKQDFINQAQEEFEVRVGRRIALEMNDTEMEEFANLTDTPTIAEWLDQHIPNYRNLVEQVYQSFQEELIAERENILS